MTIEQIYEAHRVRCSARVTIGGDPYCRANKEPGVPCLFKNCVPAYWLGVAWSVGLIGRGIAMNPDFQPEGPDEDYKEEVRLFSSAETAESSATAKLEALLAELRAWEADIKQLIKSAMIQAEKATTGENESFLIGRHQGKNESLARLRKIIKEAECD